MATNGHTNGSAKPSITLYTNHLCPYAHRAHIALKELGLEYEEVIIDLDTPREAWYLEINPRGLVPSMKYSSATVDNQIITESAIVTQFLCDSFPSYLLPDSLSAPLTRARINFFVDTYNTKIGPFTYKMLLAATDVEREARARELLTAVEKEIEPLLENAAPFFGGSKELTFAEVQAAPFVLRTNALSNSGIIPNSLKEGLAKLPNYSRWTAAMTQKESVNAVWDEKKFVTRTAERIVKMKANMSGKH